MAATRRSAQTALTDRSKPNPATQGAGRAIGTRKRFSSRNFSDVAPALKLCRRAESCALRRLRLNSATTRYPNPCQ
jgi:hypothetical protein